MQREKSNLCCSITTKQKTTMDFSSTIYDHSRKLLKVWAQKRRRIDVGTIELKPTSGTQVGGITEEHLATWWEGDKSCHSPPRQNHYSGGHTKPLHADGWSRWKEVPIFSLRVRRQGEGRGGRRMWWVWWERKGEDKRKEKRRRKRRKRKKTRKRRIRYRKRLETRTFEPKFVFKDRTISQ